MDCLKYVKDLAFTTCVYDLRYGPHLGMLS